MGSHLLLAMPRTGGYSRVIALLGDSAGGGGRSSTRPGGLEQIADATLTASLQGLELAKGDEGLAYCIYLIVQMTRAARKPEFLPALAQMGVLTPAGIGGLPDVPIIHEPSDYTVYDLTSGFSTAVDDRLRAARSRTDIGELAQLSGAECLSSFCADATGTLFGGEAPSTVQASLMPLSTQAGFARLAHDFFARFVRRFLEYHLSRELSNHVGPGRRFANVDEHNQFLVELDHHCRVCTSVLSTFAGQWYRRHNRLDDMSPKTAQAFAAHAVDKVRGALAYQEGRNVPG